MMFRTTTLRKKQKNEDKNQHVTRAGQARKIAHDRTREVTKEREKHLNRCEYCKVYLQLRGYLLEKVTEHTYEIAPFEDGIRDSHAVSIDLYGDEADGNKKSINEFSRLPHIAKKRVLQLLKKDLSIRGFTFSQTCDLEDVYNPYIFVVIVY